MKKIVIIALTMLMLVGCSKPLPADKLSYVGEWESQDMYLLILADGSVSYERLTSSGSTSMNAPLQAFIGEDFKVGIGFMSTTFDVTTAPYQRDGQWFMVVDGVTLTKR